MLGRFAVRIVGLFVGSILRTHCWFGACICLLLSRNMAFFSIVFLSHWVFIVVFTAAATAVAVARIASVLPLSYKFMSWYFAHMFATFDLTLDGTKFARQFIMEQQPAATAPMKKLRRTIFLPLSLLKRHQIALIKLTQTPFNSKCARAFIGWKPKKTTTTKRCITCFGNLLHVFYPFGRKKKTRTNVCAEYLQKEAVPTGNWKRRFLMRRFFFISTHFVHCYSFSSTIHMECD